MALWYINISMPLCSASFFYLITVVSKCFVSASLSAPSLLPLAPSSAEISLFIFSRELSAFLVTEGNDTVSQKKHREWDGGEGEGGESREEKRERGCEVGRKSKAETIGAL